MTEISDLDFGTECHICLLRKPLHEPIALALKVVGVREMVYTPHGME